MLNLSINVYGCTDISDILLYAAHPVGMGEKFISNTSFVNSPQCNTFKTTLRYALFRAAKQICSKNCIMGKIFQCVQWMDATKIQILKKRIEKHLVLEPNLQRLHCVLSCPGVSQRYSHLVKACYVRHFCKYDFLLEPQQMLRMHQSHMITTL